jgi:hypothetical protein
MATLRCRVWRRKTPTQRARAALTRFSVQRTLAGREARFF